MYERDSVLSIESFSIERASFHDREVEDVVNESEKSSLRSLYLNWPVARFGLLAARPGTFMRCYVRLYVSCKYIVIRQFLP